MLQVGVAVDGFAGPPRNAQRGDVRSGGVFGDGVDRVDERLVRRPGVGGEVRTLTRLGRHREQGLLVEGDFLVSARVVELRWELSANRDGNVLATPYRIRKAMIGGKGREVAGIPPAELNSRDGQCRGASRSSEAAVIERPQAGRRAGRDTERVKSGTAVISAQYSGH